MVYLAHFTGSGIKDILELDEAAFADYLEAAITIDQKNQERIIRVVIAGTEQ